MYDELVVGELIAIETSKNKEFFAVNLCELPKALRSKVCESFVSPLISAKQLGADQG